MVDRAWLKANPTRKARVPAPSSITQTIPSRKRFLHLSSQPQSKASEKRHSGPPYVEQRPSPRTMRSAMGYKNRESSGEVPLRPWTKQHYKNGESLVSNKRVSRKKELQLQVRPEPQTRKQRIVPSYIRELPAGISSLPCQRFNGVIKKEGVRRYGKPPDGPTFSPVRKRMVKGAVDSFVQSNAVPDRVSRKKKVPSPPSYEIQLIPSRKVRKLYACVKHPLHNHLWQTCARPSQTPFSRNKLTNLRETKLSFPLAENEKFHQR